MRPGSPTRLNHWEIGLPEGGREGRNARKRKRPFSLENIPQKYPHLLSKRLTSKLLLSRAVTFLCTSIMKDSSYTSYHLSLVALMLACFKVKSKASERQSKACCLCKVLFPSWNSSGRGLAWSLLWRREAGVQFWRDLEYCCPQHSRVLLVFRDWPQPHHLSDLGSGAW